MKNATREKSVAKSSLRDEDFINGMPFFGGRPWLDLLNTKFVLGNDHRDFVATPENLTRWLEAAGIAVPGTNLGQASRDAVELRETLRQAVDDLRLRETLSESILTNLNRWLDPVRLRFNLIQDENGLRLVESLDSETSGTMGAIVEDFARFISEFEPARLKHCSNPSCTMVFYDHGKNCTRRWCTMSICGNRDKVARYRAKKAQSEDVA